MIRVDVVFDVPTDFADYYWPTLHAIDHAATALEVEIERRVVRTELLTDDYLDDLPDAVVIGPGTPYTNPDGAEAIIRSAREKGLPLVAT